MSELRVDTITDELGTGSPSFPNNVGIGTTSPAVPLHVAKDSGTARLGQLQFTNSSGSFIADTDGVFIFPFSDGNTYLNNYDGGWVFRTGANVERMRIDSAGRVTMPGQPYFMGVPSVDYSSGGMPAGIMGISAVFNNGGHFNSSNSRFTAPVAGWYQTTWGGLQLSSTVTSLMKNGSRLRNGNHGVFTGSYITMTQTAIEYLNAGDYLNIEQWNGGGYYSSWYIWTVNLLG